MKEKLNLELTPVDCLTDIYAYIIHDNKSYNI